jgi:tetratricopeptide (TPR) repeat protein
MAPRLKPDPRPARPARLSPWPGHPAGRGGALAPVLVALSLAACGSGVRHGWWGLQLTQTAEAAPARGPGETAAGSYLSGRYALEGGDLRAAAQGFEQALAADPDNLDLRRQVFALLLASGEFDQALPAAHDLLELDANSDEAVLFLALYRTRQGDHAGALALIGALGRDGIVGTVRPILSAWASFGAGDEAGALRSLAAQDARGGLDRLRAYHRAAMLGLAGRPREGLEVLRGAFPDLATAPARVVRAAAQLQAAAGERAAAESLVAAARAAEPADRQFQWLGAELGRGRTDLAAIQGPATGMGDALIGIAEALADQDDHAQALVFARLASFVTPEDGEAWLLIARVALKQSHPAEALRALEQVPAGSPVAWAAGLTQAQALQDLERVDEAVALLEAMADQAPDRSDSLVALGDLLRQEERFAEAESAYSRATARLPEVDRRHWRLFYARGIAYERTKRWPQAEADLLKALELEPEQPFVLNYLGYSWVDQGLNLDRAQEMLHRAVELRPEDGFIVDSLGWAYFRLGENDKAVTYLERAVELEPGDPVINDHLGDAYWRAGRTREARFQWQRALTFKPEPDAVATIQQKLAEGLPDAGRRPG